MPTSQPHSDQAHQPAHKSYLHPVEAHTCLLEAMGDTPWTVIAGRPLRRGLGRAYVAGDPAAFEAAVVQAAFDPPDWSVIESTGFGSHAEAKWAVLR